MPRTVMEKTVGGWAEIRYRVLGFVLNEEVLISKKTSKVKLVDVFN